MGERTTTCLFAHTLHHKIPAMGSNFRLYYVNPDLEPIRETSNALLTTKK